MTENVQPIPFIKRVRIKNFKSIESCDVELGPLTVLVGLNAAGKSNFLDALRFVVDALSNGLESAVAQRSGPDRLWFRGAQEQPLSIELELDLQRPVGHGHDPANYGLHLGLIDINGRLRVQVLHESFGFVSEDGGTHTHATADLRDPSTGAANLVASRLDLLLRNIASRTQELSGFYRGLLGISLHAPDPGVMRQVEPAEDWTRLGLHGDHLGDILKLIASGWPDSKKRIDAYLASIVPGAVGIEHLDLGGKYSGVQLRMRDPETGAESVFLPESISDGTLRASGVLAALFQPDSLQGYITTVCIDEPELGMHPSAAGMLFYALVEATQHVQVIVATQSGDLLHRDEVDLDAIRVVAMRNGRTVIGPVDSVTREIVSRKLATVGERMRLDQILPAQLEGEE